jgi:hypothetical protein
MRSLVIILTVFFLSACSSTPTSTRLMPRSDGTISAISTARDESIAAIASTKEAKRYCTEQKKSAVFLDESTEYQGILTSRGARTVRNIPTIGRGLTSDEDFRVTVSFRCETAE